MWLREPVLILTIAVAALGLLFAIRRALGETSATSSDGAASNPEASRGNAGVIAPPPVIFLGFLALAAILEALVPSPTATLFPYNPVCCRRGTLNHRISRWYRRPARPACCRHQYLDGPTYDGACSRRHLQTVAQPALSRDDARLSRACHCGGKRLGNRAPHPAAGSDARRRHFPGRRVS